MPTPAEQKALAFVAIVILLGGAVRVVRAGSLAPVTPTPAEQQGLARQAFAASSSAVEGRRAKAARSGKTRQRDGVRVDRRRSAGVRDVGGVLSVPFSDVRPDRSSPGTWPADGRNALGFPPPAARVDTDLRRSDGPALVAVGRSGKRTRALPGRAPGPVDLDMASREELETLPRIGPALARRIVANRDSLGPFRSLAALRRVRGVGPATLELLAPLVTFSGQTRQ